MCMRYTVDSAYAHNNNYYSFFVKHFSLTVFEKLAYAKTLVEELKNKSAKLDCKVDDVQEIVANFKCAFKSL